MNIRSKGKTTMKLVSWNVNGLRACINKGFKEYFQETDADIFCIQEIKLQEGQVNLDHGEVYSQFWNYAITKGYSGTAVFTKVKPLSVRYGMEEDNESEGRILTLEFEGFYLINVYTPNARRDLSRLELRMEWEDRFRSYLLQLDAKKPVIACGDLNVAHEKIDLKNWKGNLKNAGFTPEEREKMTLLLDAGFIDTFRHLYPDKIDAYSWWSNSPGVREKNVGWRIDYFLASARLASLIVDSKMDPFIKGSDHCPVILEIAEIV
jgi:exodeoxyribonuclease-3